MVFAGIAAPHSGHVGPGEPCSKPMARYNREDTNSPH